MTDLHATPIALNTRLWTLGPKGRALNWASWREHTAAVVGRVCEMGSKVTADEWRALGFPYAGGTKEMRR